MKGNAEKTEDSGWKPMGARGWVRRKHGIVKSLLALWNVLGGNGEGK
jgi:hypothetical protein